MAVRATELQQGREQESLFAPNVVGAPIIVKGYPPSPPFLQEQESHPWGRESKILARVMSFHSVRVNSALLQDFRFSEAISDWVLIITRSQQNRQEEIPSRVRINSPVKRIFHHPNQKGNK
jgi:hypothetical protein